LGIWDWRTLGLAQSRLARWASWSCIYGVWDFGKERALRQAVAGVLKRLFEHVAHIVSAEATEPRLDCETNDYIVARLYPIHCLSQLSDDEMPKKKI
jgi:hypothetical protein